MALQLPSPTEKKSLSKSKFSGDVTTASLNTTNITVKPNSKSSARPSSKQSTPNVSPTKPIFCGKNTLPKPSTMQDFLRSLKKEENCGEAPAKK